MEVQVVEKVEEKTRFEKMSSLYGFEFRDRDKRYKEDTPDRNKDDFKDVKHLWQRTHEILNLASLGYKNTEIVKITGLSESTVSRAINSTLGSVALADKRKDRDGKFEELREDVIKLTEKSLKVYHEIFDEPAATGRVSLEMKRKTADTITLELSGLRAPTKIDSRRFSTTATIEEIEDFKRRGMEAAKVSGKIIEVEGEGNRNDSVD